MIKKTRRLASIWWSQWRSRSEHCASPSQNTTTLEEDNPKTKQLRTSTTKRDAYFDNARFLLILLVVFGHLISPLKSDNDLLYGLYKFIYLFHMPAFILISGYFSKGFDKPGYLKKTFTKTLIPYAIFQIIYCFFYYFTGYDKDFSFSLFDPHWTLWFLISLFCWNVLLKLFAKKSWALPVAFAIGIAAGYIPFFGSYLSIERTLIFFPFFLIGYLMHSEHFHLLRSIKGKLIALPVLVAVFIGCNTLIPDSFNDWLLGSSSYADMGYKDWSAGLLRTMFYGLNLIMTFSFLAIIPKKHYFFTVYGARTLYIYLLHGFFIKLVGLTDSYNDIHEIYQYVMLLIGAAALCRFLGSDVVKNLAKPLIELKPPAFFQSRKTSTN